MSLPQQTSQLQSQHFLLKWNNHRSNMVNVFESLLTAENLVDVTIAVEGKFLKAHKIVLSACSPYFQTMFVNHSPSDRYPILLFHDIKFAHLKTLLDFMYRGEISIDEKDLGDVLKVAEALSIRGLSSFESDDEEGEAGSKPEQGQSQGGSNQSSNQGHGQGQGQGPGPGGGGGERENGVTSSQEFDSHEASTSGSGKGNVAPGGTNGASGSGGTSHGKSGTNHKPKGTKTKGKLANSTHSHSHAHPTKRQKQGKDLATSRSRDVSTMAKSGKDKKGGGVKCKLEKLEFDAAAAAAAATDLINATMVEAAAEVLPIKKKRGRAKKIVLDLPLPVTPRPSTSPHQYTNTKSPSKFQSTSATSATSTSGKGSPPVPRHGVRRRIPRRYPGVPTRLKRIKLSKSVSGGSETNNGSGGGADAEQNPYDEIDDALLQQMLEGEDCEPLSEMSVRGLDLFRYASVEDNVYRCIECEKLRIPKTFKNKYSFQRHAFLYHEGNMRKVFPCPVCSREFSRPDKMKNHMRSVHEGGTGKEGAAGAAAAVAAGSENGQDDSAPKMELEDDTVLRNEVESSCDS